MSKQVKNITKNVVFEEKDYKIIKSFAQRNGYGKHGFSAALRRVIREWAGGIKPQVDDDPDPNDGHLVTVIGKPEAGIKLTEGIKPPDKSEEFLFLIGDTSAAEKAAG
jgi:hypothetical protein